MAMQTGLGLLAVLYMAVRSYRRRSLTPAGIAAACIVGTAHALHPYRLIILLLTFFICGTKLTSWGSDVKEQLLHTSHDIPTNPKQDEAVQSNKTADGLKSQQMGRTATQVFCNSGPATVCALLHLLIKTRASVTPISSRPEDLLITAIVAQYACSAGDTFSSEIGILNDSWPLLITTLRKVPPGTNGAVSVLGLLAALMGGSIIGMTAACVLPTSSWSGKVVLLLIGLVAGVAGSLLDSLLGATCQKTLYNQEMKKVVERHGGGSMAHAMSEAEKQKFIVLGHDLLDNNQVNLVSALLTMVLTATSLAALDYLVNSIF